MASKSAFEKMLFFMCYNFKLILMSASEKYADLGVEGASGLLEAEIVVQLFVCEVAAFQGYVVSSVLEGVADAQVV